MSDWAEYIGIAILVVLAAWAICKAMVHHDHERGRE